VRDRKHTTEGRSRLCDASKSLPLAVDRFALAEQEGDRSEAECWISPTPNLGRTEQYRFPT